MERMDFVRVKLVKEKSVPYGARANTPDEAIRLLRNYLEEFAQETVAALYLSLKNEVLNASIVSVGTLDSSLIDPRTILQTALLCNAKYVIIFHNHPSGDPTPSGYDDAVTERMEAACEIMGIPLRDHIVVGNGTYYSYFEMGRMKLTGGSKS